MDTTKPRPPLPNDDATRADGTVADGATRPDANVRVATGRPLPNVPGYEVLELVGRGGMGRVYRARHLALDRVVALKLLVHEADEHLLARFREETRAVARLQHPNIAQLYETGSADGRPYFALEFLDGGSLAQALAGRPQPPRDAAELVELVAHAVHHSHTHGILHRDLKPGNILLAKKHEGANPKPDHEASTLTADPRFAVRISDYVPKVADFGLAKALEPSAPGARDSDGALTRTGEVLGTPGYMPPEQASGAIADLGPATDVYALGAVLYEALTGRPPFQSPDPMQTILMVLNREPVAPRSLQPDVPRDLETICLKCLEKSQKKRYASARDLADDLRRFLDGRPIVARPVGTAERAAKWARRNKAAAALVAVSVVAGLLLLAAGVALGVGFFRLKDANADLANKNEQLDDANKDVTAKKDEVERARAETEQTLALTLTALDRYFFEFSDRLKDVPDGELLRLDALKNARRTLDALDLFRPDDPTVQNYRMAGYDKLGSIEAALGATSAAELSYTKARDTAVRLAARFPGDILYERNRALAGAKISTLLRRRGDEAAADALLDPAAATAEALAAAHPDDAKVIELRAVVREQLLYREMKRGRWEQIEPGFRELCDLYRRLAKAEPDNPLHARNVIDADRRLAVLLLDFNKHDEAGPVLARAATAADALTDRETVPVRKLRAAVNSTLGGYLADRKQYPQSVAAYGAARAEYEWLAQKFPRRPEYRYEQASVLYYMANPVSLVGDVKTAVKHLEESERLLAELAKQHPTDAEYRDLHGRVSNLLTTIRAPAKPPNKKPPDKKP